MLRRMTQLLRRIGASWPLGPMLRHPPVERVVSVFLRSTTVRERARFVLRELPRRTVFCRYTLRRSGLPIFIRHATPDVVTLDEVFYHCQYELPADVAARLEALGRPPKVVDLGANIGLFGVYVLGLFAGAHVTAIEADPANAAVLRLCAKANADRGEWLVVEAAASNRDGTVEFASGGYSLSHQAGPGERGESVRAVDVFPYLAGADLLKMDIEGGEWAILGDPRLQGSAPPAIVLEYHPHLCPEPGSRAAAVTALEAAGFEVHPFAQSNGYGMAWASSRRTGTSPTTG
jgi:FkbM family methyltransferase